MCVYREEFDASSNSIEVRLHLAPHYRAEMGALRPVGDTKDAVITITFDRRKTVGDLRLAVYQVTSLNRDTASMAHITLKASSHQRFKTRQNNLLAGERQT